MKTTLFAGASVGLCILASAGVASAQSMDYGSLEQLFNEPVTTSATGSPQRATEAPVDMTIISASDIKRSGAGDLPTILSRVAGVDVLNFAAGQSDVGIRGYNQARSPRLLVLINGRQVYLDHFGYTDWNAPADRAERNPPDRSRARPQQRHLRLQRRVRRGQHHHLQPEVRQHQCHRAAGRHAIRVGGEYRHNTLNTAPIGGADVSYDVWSASAMWNWAITDKLTTTAAVRFDKLQLERKGSFPARIPLANNALWDRDVSEPSVNLTAAWRPTDFDTVRLSYARGVQAPSLIEFGGVQLASGPVFLLGNPKLEPTIVVNYEAAYDRQLKNAKLGVRLFIQDWSDLKSSIGARAGKLWFQNLNEGLRRKAGPFFLRGQSSQPLIFFFLPRASRPG
jgi:outer membrane receptor protein involved in Fe transport